MSKLIVEVCRVEKIEPHPNAERLAVATVKGWKLCIQHDPATGVSQFAEGEKCVFFPPDAVLPPALCHGPTDNPPGRMNNIKYLHHLPKDENGVRPAGGRVVACRLRGHVSFGVILKLDAAWGDDLDWEVGTDVADHYGVTKYDPPPESNDGEAEKSNSRFHRYTEIENFANYPKAIPVGDEVIFTEKIHGKNCRVGLVLEDNEEGVAAWTFMAGSHDVRRKEHSRVETRYRLEELQADGVIAATSNKEDFSDIIGIGDVFTHRGRNWQVESVFPWEIKPFTKVGDRENDEVASVVWKCQCFEVREDKANSAFNHCGWTPVLKRSEFWSGLTCNVSALLEYIRDELPWNEPKHGIIIFGELYGAGVQDMAYGLKDKDFAVFDLAINGRYVDFDKKVELCNQFGITMVPILYRGPFSAEVLEQYTSGPTTLCAEKDAGAFKGREGIVCTPVKEVDYCDVLNGRRIVKSVSADYHARKGGTEFH